LGVEKKLIKFPVFARSHATKQSHDPNSIMAKFTPPFRGAGGQRLKEESRFDAFQINSIFEF
jgi:hypothetical protein